MPRHLYIYIDMYVCMYIYIEADLLTCTPMYTTLHTYVFVKVCVYV